MEGCVFLKQTRPLGSKDKQKTNVVCASLLKSYSKYKGVAFRFTDTMQE